MTGVDVMPTSGKIKGQFTSVLGKIYFPRFEVAGYSRRPRFLILIDLYGNVLP